MILSGLGLNFSYIFESFFCDFEWFWAPILEYLALWRVPGPSLVHPGGPLGGQGAPNMDPGSEKLVRWTPPWPPQMTSFLHNFSMFFLIENALIFD